MEGRHMISSVNRGGGSFEREQMDLRDGVEVEWVEFGEHLKVRDE